MKTAWKVLGMALIPIATIPIICGFAFGFTYGCFMAGMEYAGDFMRKLVKNMEAK